MGKDMKTSIMPITDSFSYISKTVEISILRWRNLCLIIFSFHHYTLFSEGEVTLIFEIEFCKLKKVYVRKQKDIWKPFDIFSIRDFL